MVAGNYWRIVVDGSMAEQFGVGDLDPPTLADESESAGRELIVDGSQRLREHVGGPRREYSNRGWSVGLIRLGTLVAWGEVLR